MARADRLPTKCRNPFDTRQFLSAFRTNVPTHSSASENERRPAFSFALTPELSNPETQAFTACPRGVRATALKRMLTVPTDRADSGVEERASASTRRGKEWSVPRAAPPTWARDSEWREVRHSAAAGRRVACLSSADCDDGAGCDPYSSSVWPSHASPSPRLARGSSSVKFNPLTRGSAGWRCDAGKFLAPFERPR
jgi:hypothetical protein